RGPSQPSHTIGPRTHHIPDNTPLPAGGLVRCRSLLPLVAAVLLLPACDATGPDEPEIHVALSVDASLPTASMGGDTLRVECVGTFRATATGRSGDVVLWRHGVRRWFVGLERTTPVQVDSIPLQESIEFWQV